MKVLAATIALALALLATRASLTGAPTFAFLARNLALALVPVALAWPERGGPARLALFWLFFPNAAYLVTDLVHLRVRDVPFWFDVGMLSAFALAGLAAGRVALSRMAARVAPGPRRVAFVLGLSLSAGFAIWIGRFLRLNSWDPLLRPWASLDTIARGVADRPAQALGVTLVFGALALVTSYGTTDPATRAHPPSQATTPS